MSGILRWLRFFVFATFVVVVLAIHARALRLALTAVVSRAAFMPSVPSLPAALALLAAAAVYAVWLSGATVAHWPMPAGAHVVVAAALVASASLGPLELRGDGDSSGPADRAVTAMQALAARLEKRGPSLCVAPPDGLAKWIEQARLPPTGYRSFGRTVPFRLISLGTRPEPQRTVRAGDDPGSLYLVCGPNGTFWLSAVITQGAVCGTPTMALDGAGKAAIVAGEL